MSESCNTNLKWHDIFAFLMRSNIPPPRLRFAMLLYNWIIGSPRHRFAMLVVVFLRVLHLPEPCRGGCRGCDGPGLPAEGIQLSKCHFWVETNKEHRPINYKDALMI